MFYNGADRKNRWRIGVAASALDWTDEIDAADGESIVIYYTVADRRPMRSVVRRI